MAACSQERTGAPVPPVYDVDVAPILQAHCVECHGDTNPAAGWSATSFLGAIACVEPSNVPATLPPSDQAPILAALATAPHVGLLSERRADHRDDLGAGERPLFRPDVHDPSIIDPRSAGFHGAILRASHWSQMLDAGDPNACGGCHDGAPTRPAGVTQGDPAAPDCTSCHDQPGGALACSTCHGSGDVAFPAARSMLLPRRRRRRRSRAARRVFAGEVDGGVPCSTCHPVPGSPVIGGLHGDGIVEVTFDPIAVPGAGELRPRDRRLLRLLPRSRAERNRTSPGRRQRPPSPARTATSRRRRPLQRAMQRLSFGSQRFGHRADRRPAAPERKGRPRQRKRPVRSVSRDGCQSVADHGCAPAHQNPTTDRTARVLELPRGACDDSRPDSPRRYCARHVLGARPIAEAQSRSGMAPSARTSHATEPTSPTRRRSRPGATRRVCRPNAARATGSRPRSTRPRRTAVDPTATAAR
jgi:hypothetical protein